LLLVSFEPAHSDPASIEILRRTGKARKALRHQEWGPHPSMQKLETNNTTGQD